MKKFILSAFVIGSFIAYSFVARHQDSHNVSASTSVPQNNSSSSSAPNTSSTSGTNSTTYKDGSYAGTAADAFYGNIQVKAIIQGGKLTAVQFLQYPNDRRNSIEINQQAMPILEQEAIKAQGSHVNGVSGATDTSQAFIQSLSSALSQAV